MKNYYVSDYELENMLYLLRSSEKAYFSLHDGIYSLLLKEHYNFYIKEYKKCDNNIKEIEKKKEKLKQIKEQIEEQKCQKYSKKQENKSILIDKILEKVQNEVQKSLKERENKSILIDKISEEIEDPYNDNLISIKGNELYFNKKKKKNNKLQEKLKTLNNRDIEKHVYKKCLYEMLYSYNKIIYILLEEKKKNKYV